MMSGSGNVARKASTSQSLGAAPTLQGLRMLFFADASSVHSRRWIEAVCERGAQVRLITRLPAHLPMVERMELVRPGTDKASWLLGIAAMRAAVARLTQDWQPDLVHGHFVTSYGLWASLCGLSCPKVVTAWGSDILVSPKRSRFMHMVAAWALRHADLITADSLDMLDEIGAYHPSAPCHQILWGADTAFFTPGSRSLGARFDVVSARSWEPLYNIDVVLDAFAQVLRLRPQLQAHLHLLGGGSLEASLRQQVAALGIGPQVSFHGRLGDVAMREVLQGAQVGVSVPSSDATSVCVLESMACGLAVVASDLPANRQWLQRDGASLVPARDTQALTDALLQLADDPGLAQALGRRLHERVLDEGSRQAQMDGMARLYLKLMERRSTRLSRPRAVGH